MAEDQMTEKLHQYIDRWRGYAWEWGTHDCCTFVADRVRDLTGTDPMAPWRGKYKSERKALRLIDEAGGLAALFEEAGPPFPEACIVTYVTGQQVGGLANESFVWHFTPKGVAAINRSSSRVKVQRF